MENDTEKNKVGRPSLYSEEVGKKICEQISTTIKGLSNICDENDDLPCPSTIFLWLTKHKEFSESYARAKETQAEILADQMLAIADENTNDWKENRDGEYIPDNEVVQRSRLRIDTRKWLMSKLLPKKYGDKITNVLEDSEGKGITVITLNTPRLSTESPPPE